MGYYNNHSHHHDPHHACGHNHHHGHHENHWHKASLGLLYGIGLLLLSIASFNIPLIFSFILSGFTTLMTLYLGRTVYQNAWHALLKKKWDTSTLYTISTFTIVMVSIISMLVPGLPMMFEAAPLVLGFWHLGEAIEHTLIEKINRKLNVLDCIPTIVLLKNSGKKIPVKKLILDDIIIVTKGNVIPIDGILAERTLLYTTRIDGSPDLKEFKANAPVKAGMRLADHLPSLEMRVTNTFENSYLSLIAKNIKKAHDEKAPIEIFANKILKYFIPGLLSIALASGIIIGAVFSPALAIQCVISVLVSACPCALSLITPLAVRIGMKKASEKGLHFKNGKILQATADIDTVVFDLNGTLTEGNIIVEALNITDKNFLRHIALLESKSDHPVGTIIKSYIEKQGIIPNESLGITYVDKSHHSGIKGLINNEQFIIGNKEMLLANGINTIDKPFDKPEKGSIYVVHGAKVIGQIALTDPLRKDAFTTIKELERLGKRVHICTGADKTSAEKYAKLLGIPKKNICANAVGAETRLEEISKAGYIKQLKNKGFKVAMVGDAINDVTAIASSDIGIAVKSNIGDEVTQHHAGIVVRQGLLFPIATAFDVAKKTKKNILQNLIISLTYNSTITLFAAGSFVALGFTLNPVFGVALMVLESSIVLLNLYRFKQQEVVSAASEKKHELVNKPFLQNSTLNVLNALGFRSHPKERLIDETKPKVLSPKESNLFAHSTSQRAQQEVMFKSANCS